MTSVNLYLEGYSFKFRMMGLKNLGTGGFWRGVFY